MSGETKLVNASLFAFNNQILAMSNVVKKTKINIIQKLIRRIKQLSNKKGNETELAKNKRKCENLKHEIESVKKAKLNDVAILAFDNDGVKYEEYMKKNPKISGDEVAIARIAFHKLFETSIEKIKSDPKLEGGWKKIFIQFKSRNEKRKNWKEKQKLYKIIEEKLEAKNENEDGDEEKEDVETANDEQEKSTESDQPATPAADQEPKKEKKKKEKEIVKKEKLVIDSDGLGDSENGVVYNPEEDEEELDMDREVAFSEDEDSEAGSMPDFGFPLGGDGEEDDDDEDGGKEDEDDEDLSSDSDEPAPVIKKQRKEPKPLNLAPKRELKPLVVDNKPARMVIKQLNLDELKDLNEIPIESNPELVVEDEEDEPELSTKKNGQYESNGYNDYEDAFKQAKTIKATEDPFFLDQNGKEIQDVHNLIEKNNAIYYNNRFNKPRYRKDDDDFDYNYDEKDQFIQKRTSLNNSSFKSALSSQDGGGNRNTYGRDGRSSYNSDRNYGHRSYDSHRGRGNAFRPSSDRGGDYQGSKRPFDNSNNNRQQSHFSGRGQQYASASSDSKPSVELAKNHPSWLAKKQQEEKLKNQKFEGKKIVFDD